MSAITVKKSNDILWHSELTQQNLDYMNDISNWFVSPIGRGVQGYFKIPNWQFGEAQIFPANNDSLTSWFLDFMNHDSIIKYMDIKLINYCIDWYSV